MSKATVLKVNLGHNISPHNKLRTLPYACRNVMTNKTAWCCLKISHCCLPVSDCSYVSSPPNMYLGLHTRNNSIIRRKLRAFELWSYFRSSINCGDLDLLYIIIKLILLEINDLKNQQSFPILFCRNFIIITVQITFSHTDATTI